MLVNSRPAPEAVRPFGKLEVTFAWEPAESSTANVMSLSEARRGDSGLENIRLEIRALRAAIGKKASRTAVEATETISHLADEIVQLLQESGIAAEVARDIAATGSGNIPAALKARLSTVPFPPLNQEETRTLAFIGPAGRGKTTSLVKVAIQHGVACRIPTKVITVGTHGVGAVEEMARYAAIVGVPHLAIDSYDGLNLALQGDRWRGLLLIDTPGTVLSERREKEAAESFLAARTDIETHLVLRAEACSADMQSMVEKFAKMRPSRLLFTGLDEAGSLGAMANTMIQTCVAATFWGTGSQIPEGLGEVSADAIVRSLWKSNEVAGRAA